MSVHEKVYLNFKVHLMPLHFTISYFWNYCEFCVWCLNPHHWQLSSMVTIYWVTWLALLAPNWSKQTDLVLWIWSNLAWTNALIFFPKWTNTPQIARFTWPSRDPQWLCRPHVGPMLAPWALLSRILYMSGYFFVQRQPVLILLILPSLNLRCKNSSNKIIYDVNKQIVVFTYVSDKSKFVYFQRITLISKIKCFNEFYFGFRDIVYSINLFYAHSLMLSLSDFMPCIGIFFP